MSFIQNFIQSIQKPTLTATNLNQSKLLSALQTKDVHTFNRAITHSTTLNALVDLFFLAGASRRIDEDDIETLLQKSMQAAPELTIKLIFWAGDVRGGAGERRFFKIALRWLERYHPNVLAANIDQGNVQFFNRWDMLFWLVNDAAVRESVLRQVEQGLENQDALLAKWLPRKDQYQNFKKLVQSKLGINDREYRKLIVHLSDTVEQKMSHKQWSEVDYQKVPSQAFNKYRQAFLRNDPDRFNQFIELVNTGQAKINASVLFPHQLYQAYNQNKDAASIEAQWNQLPDFLKDSKERILPVCDVSGSMMGLPMDVSVSFGIYISERNQGIFQNAFMTFSQDPKLQYLSGTLGQRIQQLQTAEWGMNTDLYKVFRVLLRKAQENRIDAHEMPTMVLIFSDMEFDQAVLGETNLDAIQELYLQAGYSFPKLVFWNLNGRLGNVPAQVYDQNVALVSGFSPQIVDAIAQGNIDQFTPLAVVQNLLGQPRFDRVITTL